MPETIKGTKTTCGDRNAPLETNRFTQQDVHFVGQGGHARIARQGFSARIITKGSIIPSSYDPNSFPRKEPNQGLSTGIHVLSLVFEMRDHEMAIKLSLNC